MKRNRKRINLVIIGIGAFLLGTLMAYAGPPRPAVTKVKPGALKAAPNAKMPKKPKPSGPPELKGSIKVEPALGSYKCSSIDQRVCTMLGVRYTVTNKGGSYAKNFRVKLEGKPQVKYPNSTPQWKLLYNSGKLSLRPGMSWTGTFGTLSAHEFDWCECRYGKVVFRLSIDYENRVAEKNENNNIVTVGYPLTRADYRALSNIVSTTPASTQVEPIEKKARVNPGKK